MKNTLTKGAMTTTMIISGAVAFAGLLGYISINDNNIRKEMSEVKQTAAVTTSKVDYIKDDIKEIKNDVKLLLKTFKITSDIK